MIDQLDFEKALELLQKVEPSWKGTITPANRSDLFTRPPEPRINRFRFDDGLSVAGSGAGSDGLNGENGQNGKDGTPAEPLQQYQCSGNLNGQARLIYLFGPEGQ